MRLLAVFAHPDDESFGVGGTLARYAAEGVQVHLVCATRGEAGSTGDPPLCAQEELGALREQELRAACTELGVRSLRFLGCVDGRVDSCPWPSLLGEVVATIRELRPQVVITFGPDGISGHPDHVAMGRVATKAAAAAADPRAFPEQATRGLQPWKVTKLYYLVRSRSTSVACDGAGTETDEVFATARIDAARHLHAKVRAMRCHRSQCQAFDQHPEEVLRERLRYECFRLVKPSVEAETEREDDLLKGIPPVRSAQG